MNNASVSFRLLYIVSLHFIVTVKFYYCMPMLLFVYSTLFINKIWQHIQKRINSCSLQVAVFTVLLTFCCFMWRSYSCMDCLLSFMLGRTFYVTFIPVTVCECHIELKATWLDLTWNGNIEYNITRKTYYISTEYNLEIAHWQYCLLSSILHKNFLSTFL